MHRHYLKAASAVAVSGLLAGKALAGGYALTDEQSAVLVGTANAGAAAIAEDATTIASNPAGISRITAREFVTTGTIANTTLPFTNTGSTLANGAPLPGFNDDAGNAALLPAMFLSSPVDDSLTLGLGLFSSFGLSTEYQSGWVGRYLAQDLNLTTVDLAPTASYRLSPSVSVGISPILRYTYAKDTTGVDFGSIGAGLGIPGALPGGNDGSVAIKASGWSWGLNAGILFEPFQGTRVGLAYFYNSGVRVSGGAQFQNSAVGNIISAASGAFTEYLGYYSLSRPCKFRYNTTADTSA